VREALDIVVATATGEALYEDFSGGERTRLDLSLRIALARLLAARRGADVRVLVIDEPAFLDADGFEQLAAVLRGLSTEFESVLVVSHEEALRDAFDSAIVVAGGADTGEPSRLEEVN
jgi:exonuclease SbcC